MCVTVCYCVFVLGAGRQCVCYCVFASLCLNLIVCLSLSLDQVAAFKDYTLEMAAAEAPAAAAPPSAPAPAAAAPSAVPGSSYPTHMKVRSHTEQCQAARNPPT